jgi:tetratricopeptide (TPR) repeat protein
MASLVTAAGVLPTLASAAKGEFSRSQDASRLQLGDRSKSQLPQSKVLQSPEAKQRNLGAVKPPRSSEFLESGSKEAEYERLVDKEIETLYKLSGQNKKSPNRGEIWLRLGERYVEKARLIEFRAQAEYDKRLKEYLEKRTTVKPKLDNQLAREYNQKAVELYEWFVKDFPKDPKVDQALFFLGYNQFELGNTKLGEQYYSQLVKTYPDSAFIIESHFALGEYYFENEQWQKAYEHYDRVVQAKKARLNAFALYKSAWCLYRLNRVPAGLKLLERVIRLSRASEGSENISGKAVNKVRLATEALKDYVPFYAESGEPSEASKEFSRIAGDEKTTFQMLEKLAFIYADSGNRTGAKQVFKKLIELAPASERAAEYQYQVVLAYATHDQKEFRKELEIWLESFGAGSYWARENGKNPKLVADVAKLQETTLRNYVLQLHQAAQNSRAEYSQAQANAAYAQYVKYFPESSQIVEMQFFHAELLFDMHRYEEAAKLYTWVAEKEPQGPYREKAIVNTLLALEKDLPTPKQIDEKRGQSLEKLPLEPSVQRFEAAANRYIKAFPKGEKVSDIRRRLGVLYYSYNRFDEAIEIFEKIIEDNPKSENAEVAGNLILDIYKLRNDMTGFVERGQQMLSNPAIASSKFGQQVKGMMEKAMFMRAEKLSGADPLKSAKEFESFASTYKQSEYAMPARYKAAAAYEKAGDLAAAVGMYGLVASAPVSNDKARAVQNDSRNALARIYQQTGQLELAAKQYHGFAQANPKDPKAVDAYFNAGVLFEALGQTSEALQNYQSYVSLSQRPDRVEVIFTQAEIYRKQGSAAKAEATYEQYLKSRPTSAAHALEATFWIGRLAEKNGRLKQSREWYQRVLEMYRKRGKADRGEVVRFAAEAKWRLAQETVTEISGIKFGASDKQQAQAAAKLKSLRDRYIADMKEVIRFDNAEFVVAALASTGQMFETMARVFSRIPVPSGLSGEDAQKYRELIQTQVNGFNDEAKSSYKTAVEKSLELESYSSWTAMARNGLAALDSSASVTAGDEVTSEARSADWMGL